MGLDMYLYIKGNDDEMIGYWRKANQIHRWFVENCGGGVDECQPIPVSREDLNSLLSTTQSVLDNVKLVDGKVSNGYILDENGQREVIEDGKVIEDPLLAHTLLPTTSGFFFGSTGYNEWYVEDLKDTVQILQDALSKYPEESFVYQASW